MPSSVSVGSRPPSSCWILAYSSGVSPCSRISSGVMAGVAELVMGGSSIFASEGEEGKGDRLRALGFGLRASGFGVRGLGFGLRALGFGLWGWLVPDVATSIDGVAGVPARPAQPG